MLILADSTMLLDTPLAYLIILSISKLMLKSVYVRSESTGSFDITGSC